jgi:calmodulin
VIAEFLILMSHNAKPADTDQELLRAFEVFDKDGSGTITTSELKDVLRSLGENLTDEELDEMVKLTDKNGDGVIDCKCRLVALASGKLTMSILNRP